jgi:hypothetical protein
MGEVLRGESLHQYTLIEGLCAPLIVLREQVNLAVVLMASFLNWIHHEHVEMFHLCEDNKNISFHLSILDAAHTCHFVIFSSL